MLYSYPLKTNSLMEPQWLYRKHFYRRGWMEKLWTVFLGTRSIGDKFKKKAVSSETVSITWERAKVKPSSKSLTQYERLLLRQNKKGRDKRGELAWEVIKWFCYRRLLVTYLLSLIPFCYHSVSHTQYLETILHCLHIDCFFFFWSFFLLADISFGVAPQCASPGW